TDKVILRTKTVTEDGAELSSSKDEIAAASQNEFKTAINNISAVTTYWFEYKDIQSEHYTINISSRPVIKNVKVMVYPPAYTRLPSHPAEGNEINTIAG